MSNQNSPAEGSGAPRPRPVEAAARSSTTASSSSASSSTTATPQVSTSTSSPSGLSSGPVSRSATPGRIGLGLGSPAPSGGRIGSVHDTTVTPPNRLPSLRGNRPMMPASSRGGAIVGGSIATRGGTPKMKFAPTVPTKRNKKDAPSSLLEQASFEHSGRGGRGRGGERGGRGGDRGGRGRGRGRGGFGKYEEMEAQASGPFSQGPTAFNNRGGGRAPVSSGGASGAHSSYTGLQGVKIETGGNDPISGEDRAHYGDAAVDMNFGEVTTDASVPTALQHQEHDAGYQVKKEEHDASSTAQQEAEAREERAALRVAEEENKADWTPAQELMHPWVDDQMYFFQFPSVMPEFTARPVLIPSETPTPTTSSTAVIDDDDDNLLPDLTDLDMLKVKPEPMDVDASPRIVRDDGMVTVKAENQDTKVGLSTSSTMAPPPAGQRARPTAAAAAATAKPEPSGVPQVAFSQEGKIGKLLVYKSGKVKMKIGEIVMDVSMGSKSSFLQDIVVVDSGSKQAFVMGSVQKRMVCVPNLEQLLAGLEADDSY